MGTVTGPHWGLLAWNGALLSKCPYITQRVHNGGGLRSSRAMALQTLDTALGQSVLLLLFYSQETQMELRGSEPQVI